MEQKDIFKNYPLLSSWDKSRYWTGFVSLEGKLVKIVLRTPNFPTVKGASLEGDNDTDELCEQLKDPISKLIQSNCSVKTFLDSLLDAMKSGLCKKTAKELHGPLFFSTLLNGLNEIGLDNVVFASKDHSEIHIKRVDASGRQHLIKYSLPNEYPLVPLVVTAELPQIPDNFKWPTKIVNAHKWFCEQLELFNNFWTMLDDLDGYALVLDPTNPTRSHKHRRILLDNRVILHLTFNLAKPFGFPEIRITGPKKFVSQLDTALEKNCQNWSEDLSMIQNLEDILEVQCRPSDTENDPFSELRCVVCYLYSFNDEIPDRNCDCGVNYHNKCLIDLYNFDIYTSVKKCVECPGCGADTKLME